MNSTLSLTEDGKFQAQKLEVLCPQYSQPPLVTFLQTLEHLSTLGKILLYFTWKTPTSYPSSPPPLPTPHHVHVHILTRSSHHHHHGVVVQIVIVVVVIIVVIVVVVAVDTVNDVDDELY